MTRLDSLRKIAFVEHGFDGYLIFNGANLTYFLGFQGPAALLVPPRGEAVVYVEAKNYEAAKVEGKSFRIEKFVPTDNLIMKIAKDVKACEIQHLAIDSLTVSEWQFLVKEFPKENAIVLNNGIVESLRRVKTVQEIELMRIAGKITSEGMRTAFEFIQAGVKEYEVAAEIEYAMRKCGSGPTAFESIVASGIYSAFPHGGCSDRVICEGDLVVVDIGATYKFYCSDMTRTFVVGKPTAKQQAIYNLVKKAQDSAFQLIKAGTCISNVDIAARQVIDRAGYGEYFVHRLGHMVGLEVHERPSIDQSTKDLLVAGNVFTVEPGIYIPGFGGVRIEDTVIVHKDNFEKLTCGPYTLGF